ncbi:hypothetical protein C8R43DRAFT_597197 [Mycena crocata]|nr:hypothetical protein C8R43DRAFT_597197 [Mycena crocata]
MACWRFCSLMQESPHLVPLVRRLRVSFTKEMLTALNTINFPNVSEMLLERVAAGPEPNPASISAAAELLSRQSIRRLALWSLNFRDLDDFARLFALCTPQLDTVYLHNVEIISYPPKQPSTSSMHRVTVKSLALSSLDHLPWLRDPCSPLDMSALSEFDGSAVWGQDTTVAVLEHARTLTRLKIYTAFVGPDLFASARLPSLSHLDIASTDSAEGIYDTDLLVRSIPTWNRLRVFTIEIERTKYTAVAAPKLHSFATTLATATFPMLQRLEINVLIRRGTARDIGWEDQLLAVFAPSAARPGIQFVLSKKYSAEW